MLVHLILGGSHGDIHPFLGVGRELLARGHRVVAFVNPHFQNDIQSSGLEYRELGGEVDFEAVVRDPRMMHPLKGGMFVLRLVTEATPKAVARMREVWLRERPDVVLSHHICLGIRWLCQELKLPIAIGTVSPMVWISHRGFVPSFQRKPGKAWEIAARGAGPVVELALRFVVERHFTKTRRRCGFPRESDLLRKEFLGGDRNLALWSRHFRPPAPSDPTQGKICGFPFFDGSIAEKPGIPREVKDFLMEGTPAIVFTQGTSTAYSPGRFYEAAERACAKLGRRALFLTGLRETGIRRNSGSILSASYAPLGEVLPQAAAVVHHGGIGTTALAIRAACPAAIVPQAHDQFNNAVLACKHGTAVWLDRSKMSEDLFVRGLGRLLNDPSYRTRAGQLSSLFVEEAGARTAANEVEVLARQGVSGSSASNQSA